MLKTQSAKSGILSKKRLEQRKNVEKSVETLENFGKWAEKEYEGLEKCTFFC